MKILRRFLDLFQPKPSPKQVARQLRMPTGRLGKKVGERMNATNAALYDFVFGIMAPEPGQSILEIGFGNGRFFEKLHSLSPGLRISGLDFSKKMLDEATRNNQPLILKGQLDLRFGGSSAMPFANAVFDKIFCINVVYFWEEPAHHLAEIRRVLRHGGLFYSAIRTPKTLRQFPFSRYGFKQYEPEEWAKVLETNGLEAVGTFPYAEPTMDLEGNPVMLESVCIVARKPHD